MEQFFSQSDKVLEKESHIDYTFASKEVVQDEVFTLLHRYPENFLHGLFEVLAEQDYQNSEIMTANQEGKIIGCLFYNLQTREFNWLAVSPDLKTKKSEVAKKLFENVFATLPSGTDFHWYVNTEDSSYEGYPDLGKSFEPARRLYKNMGLQFTRVENKFGIGTHAYKVEGKIVT